MLSSDFYGHSQYLWMVLSWACGPGNSKPVFTLTLIQRAKKQDQEVSFQFVWSEKWCLRCAKKQNEAQKLSKAKTNQSKTKQHTTTKNKTRKHIIIDSYNILQACTPQAAYFKGSGILKASPWVALAACQNMCSFKFHFYGPPKKTSTARWHKTTSPSKTSPLRSGDKIL